MVKRRHITIPQLAEMLGLSRIAVYRKVKKGQIPATKVGRCYVISDRYINSILGKQVSSKDKGRIEAAVRKMVQEYGDVLKWRSKE